MAEAFYPPRPATDGTFAPVPGGVFEVFELTDTERTTPLPLRVGDGNSSTTVAASDTLAVLPGTYVTSPNVSHNWVSGQFVWRRDSFDRAEQATEESRIAAVSAASDAATSAQAAIDAAGLVDAPADEAVKSLLNDPASETRDAADGLYSRKGSLFVNVKDHGVKGDGVTDDTAALQNLMNTNPGGSIFFPSGSYKVTAPLTISTSGTRLVGDAGAKLVAPSNIASFLLVTGQEWTGGAELSATVTIGGRSISTKTAHGFVAGDVIRIKSQRVSTSTDAGDWQLGWSTGTTAGPFFAEFARVYQVISSTSFTIDSGVIYPDYRPDSTAETHSGAGASATVQKFNPVRNVTIDGLTLEGPSNDAIVINKGYECVVKNCRYPQKPNSGRFVQFIESFLVEARDCFVSNNYVETLDSQHHFVNSYHIIASQASGFVNCTVVRGSQCFDITYSNAYKTTSQFCYVKDCTTLSALFNCLTTHPGTFACTITGNNFNECQRSGIAIRSNRSIVSGNTVQGTGNAGWGIAISEGGGKDSIISNNTVSSFRYGIGVRDGTDKYYAGWIGLKVDGNEFEFYNTAFHRDMDASSPSSALAKSQGIVLSNNMFRSDTTSAVGVRTCDGGKGINGLDILNNHFRLTSTSSTGVEVTANSQNIRAQGNVFDAVREQLKYDATVARTISTPTQVTWRNNVAYNPVVTTMPLPTVDFQYSLDRGEPVTSAANPHMDLFKTTGSWRASSTAQVLLTQGFPGDSWDGWWEVVKLADTNIIQYWFRRNVNTIERYQRRWNGTSFSAWVLA